MITHRYENLEGGIEFTNWSMGKYLKVGCDRELLAPAKKVNMCA